MEVISVHFFITNRIKAHYPTIHVIKVGPMDLSSMSTGCQHPALEVPHNKQLSSSSTVQLVMFIIKHPLSAAIHTQGCCQYNEVTCLLGLLYTDLQLQNPLLVFQGQ